MEGVDVRFGDIKFRDLAIRVSQWLRRISAMAFGQSEVGYVTTTTRLP